MTGALKAAVVIAPFLAVFLLLRSCGEEEAQRWLDRVREMDPQATIAVNREDLLVVAPNREYGIAMGEEAAAFKDALVEEYGDLLGRPRTQRMAIVVFSDIGLLHAWAGRRMRHGTKNLGGYTDGAQAAMFMPPDPDFSTLRHETVHWVVGTARGSGDLSPWLGEGLAQLFEPFDPRARPPVPPGISPERRAMILHVVPERIDVDRLLEMDDYGEFTGGEGLRNYLEALVLTAFLFQERDRGRLRELIETQVAGARGPTVFHNLYRPHEASFRRDLGAFLRRETGR